MVSLLDLDQIGPYFMNFPSKSYKCWVFPNFCDPLAQIVSFRSSYAALSNFSAFSFLCAANTVILEQWNPMLDFWGFAFFLVGGWRLASLQPLQILIHSTCALTSPVGFGLGDHRCALDVNHCQTFSLIENIIV